MAKVGRKPKIKGIKRIVSYLKEEEGMNYAEIGRQLDMDRQLIRYHYITKKENESKS